MQTVPQNNTENIEQNEKTVTIMHAKNVFIGGYDRGIESDLRTAVSLSRSVHREGEYKIVNGEMLASPSTDPRLHTPESDRRRFGAVRFQQGDKVRLDLTCPFRSKKSEFICGPQDGKGTVS
ncbi:unnamed protein product [Nippostrongylus brasiliensis]|uniref:FHA domain-containing protein n=1 Tax=Nippostrongylus brasiliensis TaxID=27835 RepID=A0A0N4YSA5_NIPBR|nr:unnamed protein product [Nippostrongylus brasiliensis]